MGDSTYSFGEESPLKFTIPDDLAETYNGAVEEFLRAQQRFNRKMGRRWDPTSEPIMIKWSKKQKKAWNEFGKIFKEVVEKSGPYHENDIMDDFLVKNAVSVVAGASERWKKVLVLAVGAGALYGFLNRR